MSKEQPLSIETLTLKYSNPAWAKKEIVHAYLEYAMCIKIKVIHCKHIDIWIVLEI